MDKLCIRCKSVFKKDICLFCIRFGKHKNIKPNYIFRNNKNYKFYINYKLNKNQKLTSNFIALQKRKVLVDAVCGAGKTEIVLNETETFLKKGKRVGFLTPRITITKQIHHRLKNIFKDNDVILIYGSLKPKLADIIVMTCHKASNFINQLDLVIIDEVDAFPLSDDKVLQAICNNLAIEKTIYLSATPPKQFLNTMASISLNKRFHNHKHPLPKFKLSLNLKHSLYKMLFNQKKRYFVYFPTIKMQNNYYKYFHKLNIGIVNSKSKNLKNTLIAFEKDKINIIFSTLVLERGVTFNNLNVIVINPNHNLFSKEMLIQIAGRVGRTIKNPKGKIIFIDKYLSFKIKKVIKHIYEKNEMSNM